MAKNDSAEEARRAQDIDTPAHHNNDPKGVYHWGRGGEGNMMAVGQKNGEKNGEEKKSRSKERTLSAGRGGQQRSGSFRDALGKGREMLGLKGGSKLEKGESAVEDD